VIHHQGGGYHRQSAKPVTEVIPPDTPPEDQRRVIEREINKAIPMVWKDLDLAGIPIKITWTDNTMQFDWDKAESRPRNKRVSGDLVGGYFQVRRADKSGEMFEMLIAALDQGIGVFEVLEVAARRRRTNPLDWIAYVVAFPVVVLERAGLSSSDTDSKLVAAYGWLLRGLFATALVLGLTKLGVSIPWDAIRRFLGK
jgi:hypothetical protein